MKSNEIDRSPTFRVSDLAADALRRKLGKAEKKAGLSHVVIRDDHGSIVGVLVDVDGFNVLMKSLSVIENPAKLEELKREADRSKANTMTLEEAFG